jgi:glyoxylase I family protein
MSRETSPATLDLRPLLPDALAAFVASAVVQGLARRSPRSLHSRSALRGQRGTNSCRYAVLTQSIGERGITMAGEPASDVDSHPFVKSVHGIRYQVKDVARAVAFYTQHLGFKLEHQQLPAFASISLGSSRILLSGPGASGSRPMPDGRRQEPGGWNRVVLRVADLPGCIASLERGGLRFRNQMETGPGGRQVQIEDPDGNAIELFEPAR